MHLSDSTELLFGMAARYISTSDTRGGGPMRGERRRGWKEGAVQKCYIFYNGCMSPRLCWQQCGHHHQVIGGLVYVGLEICFAAANKSLLLYEPGQLLAVVLFPKNVATELPVLIIAEYWIIRL